MQSINTILFCHKDSYYKKLNQNCYDIFRDALKVDNCEPAIYHPSCAPWGKLKQFSKFIPSRKYHAIWSVLRIWKYNGILEHPAGSLLWKRMNLPLPGKGYDDKGGFSISIDQHWFGHKAKKNTWIYVKGINIKELPAFQLNFDRIDYTISSCKRKTNKSEVNKKERELTPPALCEYLLQTLDIIKENERKKYPELSH